MELLRIHKNRSLDNRKCQSVSDGTGNSGLMDIITGALTTYSKPADTPQMNNSQAATVTGNVGEQDLYTRRQNFINDLQRYAQSGGSRSHLGRHERQEAARKWGITDQDFIKKAGKFYNASPNKQKLYGEELAVQYFRPAMQQRQQAQQAQQQADLEAAQKRRNDAANIWANQQRTAATNKFARINSVQDFQDMYNEYAKANNLTKIATDDHFGKDTQNAYTTFYNSLTDPFEREAFRSKMQGLNAPAWSSTKNKNNAHNLASINYGQEVSNDDINTYANTQTWDDERVTNLLNNNKNQVTINPVQTNKQGGSLKMKVNYFQPGGVVAAQTASAKPDVSSQLAKLILTATQDEKALTQVVQLLQSGEPQVQEAIKTMTAKAQQGDEEAAQATQVLQAIMKKMQGQAQSAKRGAKLSYLHSLKTGCPDGYEVSYNKKGGHLCKECLKKQANGGELSEEDKKMGRGTPEQVKAVAAQLKKKYPQYTKEQLAGSAPIIKNGQKYFMNGDGELIAASKLTPKDACGSKLKKKLISGKKLAEGNKITPTKQASKNFFGGKLYLNY